MVLPMSAIPIYTNLLFILGVQEKILSGACRVDVEWLQI
jgi:hypothetical protein